MHQTDSLTLHSNIHLTFSGIQDKRFFSLMIVIDNIYQFNKTMCKALQYLVANNDDHLWLRLISMGSSSHLEHGLRPQRCLSSVLLFPQVFCSSKLENETPTAELKVSMRSVNVNAKCRKKIKAHVNFSKDVHLYRTGP